MKNIIKTWEILLISFVVIITIISIGIIFFSIYELVTKQKQLADVVGLMVAGATSLSVVYLAEQIRTTSQQEKVKRSYDYLARYNSESFKETTADALEFLRDGKKGKDERWQILSNKKHPQHKKIKSVVSLYFNFFEDMAIFYNRGLLEKSLITAFFKSISLSNFDEGRDCIERSRKEDQRPSYFSEWEKMNNEMKKTKITGEK